MVKLDTARQANAELVKKGPLVAVVASGTTGIGEYTIRSLASAHGTTGTGLRIYIIGRNARAGEETIAACRQLCPKGEFIFVKVADLSLLRGVDNCCAELIELETKAAGDAAKFDLLLMTQGMVLFGGRKETSEGLDQSMSLLYYSRARFIQLLAPLLTRSSLPARVISVYAAGMESSGKFFPEDLSLRNGDHYSFSNCRAHVVHMKTMMFEHFAKQYEGKLALVHVYPGLVVTPAYYADYHPWWFKLAWKCVEPLVKAFVAVSPEEIGQRMLYLASDSFPARAMEDAMNSLAKSTDGSKGGGAYAAKWDGEAYDVQKSYVQLRRDGFERRVVEHTMKVFEEIEAGRVFKD